MAVREIGRQFGQRDVLEALEQQGFRFGEGVVECGVHGLLDQAFRVIVAAADGKDGRFAQRFVQLAQRNGCQVDGDAPAAGMAAVGGHEAGFAQQTHGPAHHHRIGAQAQGEVVGCYGRIALRHMEEGVQDGG
jgi:hypothetical protein